MRIKSPLSGFSILLLSFFITLLTPLYVAAQVDEKDKAQKEAEKRQELERKTLGLLDEIVAGAWSLKLPENRSFVLAAAADSIWLHDEKRARNLFWDALNSLGPTTSLESEGSTAKSTTKANPQKDANAKSPATKPSANDKVQSLNQYYAMFSVRREFLRRVARRDPQLALDMLRATHQQPPPQTSATYRLPDDGELEQEIANEAVTRDPKRALQIARESLTKGLTFELINLLFQLNQQDQNAGSELATDIIAKLDTENLETD